MQKVMTSIVALWVAGPALADGFQQITDKDTFVGLLNGKELTRMGIRLTVTPSGEIGGRAFGTEVYGNWEWNGGYFCRDLYYGERDLGPNCQMVQINGETMRFISDRGTGQFADLRLK